MSQKEVWTIEDKGGHRDDTDGDVGAAATTQISGLGGVTYRDEAFHCEGQQHHYPDACKQEGDVRHPEDDC